ncbi:hypothetical protein CHS0354_035297 [Potamilus streckersoni]|uniref:NADH dehydrogenase [ubiquinone] iron-sulfur protein 3, mitochondrial n=1 Tax=Potamilus streckersoni TaxID=2493646 RepID=A0AAE0S2R0_9BIVA|nr:hypothetical protein CHS0354_035297 [Potamilus streckersoni]
MYSQSLESSLAKAVADKLADKYTDCTAYLGDLTLTVPKQNIREICLALKNIPEFSFDQMMDLTAVDYLLQGVTPRFQVVYHLKSLGKAHRIRLKCSVEESDTMIDSIHDIWAAANWYERECYDMYGITFNGHPDLRRIIMYNEFEGHPLRKDYPITMEQPLVELRNIPERHHYMDKHLYRQGFEKQAENRHYIQVFPYTDRLNYCSAIINNVGYSMAVEKLFSVEVPKRAEYARVIMMEVSRIADHLTCVAASAMELGAFTFFLWFIKAREYLWELIESFTGARLTTSWSRFGGNANDFPEGFVGQLTERLQKVKEVIDEGDKLLSRNKIFIDRVKNLGVLPPEKLISYGFSGVMLRAGGIAHDLRVSEGGYSVYSDFDFEVPVGTVGDCYDRYHVRMEEMRQSIRIIEQAKDKIPDGDYQNRDRRVTIPPKSEVYGSIEGLIDHFKIIMEGHAPPKGEAYSAVEAPNGELGFYVVSDGTGRPVKVRCRPPCFNFVAAFKEMAIGRHLADLIPIFGSINMIGGELDR